MSAELTDELGVARGPARPGDAGMNKLKALDRTRPTRGLERSGDVGSWYYRERLGTNIVLQFYRQDWSDDDGRLHEAWGWQAFRHHRNGRTWLGEGVARRLIDARVCAWACVECETLA